MCIRDRNNTASEAPEKNVKTESEKIDFSKVKVWGMNRLLMVIF